MPGVCPLDARTWNRGRTRAGDRLPARGTDRKRHRASLTPGREAHRRRGHRAQRYAAAPAPSMAGRSNGMGSGIGSQEAKPGASVGPSARRRPVVRRSADGSSHEASQLVRRSARLRSRPALRSVCRRSADGRTSSRSSWSASVRLPATAAQFAQSVVHVEPSSFRRVRTRASA